MLTAHSSSFFFFFNDTATTEIYTLSLHDALPIFAVPALPDWRDRGCAFGKSVRHDARRRSEEHTSELQSLRHLVCRLLLEKKKKNIYKKRTQETEKSDRTKSMRCT